MARLWLGCLVFLMSCEEMPRTPAATTLGAAQAAAVPATRAPRFNLPELDVDATLQLGALFLDRAPAVYRVSPGRWLLEDANQLWLWESAPGRLTELGRGVTVPAPGLGRFILTDSPERALHEIAPDRPALRRVVQVPAAAARPFSVVGHLDDGAVVLAGISRDQPLSVVHPGGEPRDLPLELDGFTLTGPDAIRGKRLLVLGPWQRVVAVDVWDDPHTTAVLVVDLETGKSRTVGRGSGCFTRTYAIPHTKIAAFWAGSPAQSGHCHYAVDEVTEQTDRVP